MQADLGLDDATHASLFGASMPNHERFQGSGTCGSLWDERWADTLGPLGLGADPSDEPGEASAPVWHSNRLSASRQVGSLYGDRGPVYNIKMEDGNLTSNSITDDILDICDMYHNGPSPSASDIVNFTSEGFIQEGTHFSGDESAMRLDYDIDVSSAANDVGLSFWDGLYSVGTTSCTGGGFHQVLSEFVFEDVLSPGVGIVEEQPNNPTHSESREETVNGGEQAKESVESAAEAVGECDVSGPAASGDFGGKSRSEGNADLSCDAIVPNTSPSRLERGEVAVKAGTSDEGSPRRREGGGKQVVRSRKRQKDTGKENEGLLITLTARHEYLTAEAERLTEEVAAAKRRLIASIVGPR